MSLGGIIDCIAGFRFSYANEYQLQEGLAAALSSRGWPVEREVRLGARDRIDLLVGSVGVEVKVAGKPDSVVRQLTRYAESDDIDALVLVTSRVRHLDLPALINGKPVVSVSLVGAGL